MTPWDLAGKTEHSHQRAVFAWANCAALYGFGPAGVAETYSKDTRQDVLDAFAIARGVTGHDSAEPIPDLARLFAVHNQGHGDKIRGAQARAEGVKSGVPDMCWPRPRIIPDGTNRHYNGLWIELKHPSVKPVRATSQEATSPEQDDWLAYLTSWNYRCFVAYGWQEATVAIQEYWAGP